MSSLIRAIHQETMSNEIAVQSLSQDLSQELKVAYSCRNIPIEAMKTLISGTVTPQVGDLVLARVDTLGQNQVAYLRCDSS